MKLTKLPLHSDKVKLCGAVPELPHTP